MCAAEKWTRAKMDISRKRAAQIRFLRATVGGIENAIYSTIFSYQK
jgi:hypothetical protein